MRKALHPQALTRYKKRMRKIIFAALMLVPFLGAVASTTPPGQKQHTLCGATCTPPYCPPTDPNGCGILD